MCSHDWNLSVLSPLFLFLPWFWKGTMVLVLNFYIAKKYITLLSSLYQQCNMNIYHQECDSTTLYVSPWWEETANNNVFSNKNEGWRNWPYCTNCAGKVCFVSLHYWVKLQWNIYFLLTQFRFKWQKVPTVFHNPWP